MIRAPSPRSNGAEGVMSTSPADLHVVDVLLGLVHDDELTIGNIGGLLAAGAAAEGNGRPVLAPEFDAAC